MRISEMFRSELDVEMPYVRRHLDRVPFDKLDFKAHEKSMTLGWLATFTAIMPSIGVVMLTRDLFDFMDPKMPMERKNADSRQALLDLFDRNVAGARDALSAVTDEQMEQPWSLRAGPKVLFTKPRHLAYRTYFFNHLVHHRAQLGVYLRLNGIPVPAVYNDSADEHGGMFMEENK